MSHANMPSYSCKQALRVTTSISKRSTYLLRHLYHKGLYADNDHTLVQRGICAAEVLCCRRHSHIPLTFESLYESIIYKLAIKDSLRRGLQKNKTFIVFTDASRLVLKMELDTAIK